MHRFIRERSRELALLSRESLGDRRPRVAAIVELEPLTVAGDHSFVTDLIEIAGAENVNHGVDEPHVLMTKAELAGLAPELVLVTSAREIPLPEKRAFRSDMKGIGRIEFLVLEDEMMWLRDASETARRLRRLVRETLNDAPSRSQEPPGLPSRPRSLEPRAGAHRAARAPRVSLGAAPYRALCAPASSGLSRRPR
jgi:hypothetical protein